MLIISNGMAYGELAAVIEGLKNKSKSIGSHARRELYWQAYTKLSAKVRHTALPTPNPLRTPQERFDHSDEQR